MKIKQTFEQGGGIFCLMPVFVPSTSKNTIHATY